MSAAGFHSVAVSPALPISLAQVDKSFGRLNVLKGFNLEVRAGQFLAIVGRSGGGKSTLLRLIAGLDAPDSGRVTIAGRKVERLHPAVRLLFQEARLVPWQRVIENVGLARGPNWQELAKSVIVDVGLDGRENDWPSILSGGQKQRVALARALVSQPQILLLDEPFGALDALTRIEMHRLLEGIWGGRQFTTVLITHDVAEAVALADRVVVLKEGSIALDIDVNLARPRRELADPQAVDLQRQILEAV